MANNEHSTPAGGTASAENFRSWFMDKLLMGMSWPEYTRSLVTPFNVVVALIFLVGLPVIATRMTIGLAAYTHASNDYPWGLFLAWGLFTGEPLAATGFVITTAYYIFGFKEFRPLVRLAVLAGLLGYTFAVIFLMADLGRPWRLYYPMMVSYGTASILFVVAWSVAMYSTVQLLEFSPAVLEWIKSKRIHKWALSLTIGLTIAGILISALHQSALGAMFLMAPGKLHPLWYSQYIPELYLASAVYAGFAMLIVITTIVARFMPSRCSRDFLDTLDKHTLSMGKAAALSMYVYFGIKMIALVYDGYWTLLGTGYGMWYQVEVLGFVLAPAALLSFGCKAGSPFTVRVAALWAVLGVVMNRFNIAIIAFNWNLPEHLHHIVPPWQEAITVLTLTTVHIVLFKWVLNRMPVTIDDPDYKDVKH